MRDWSWTGPKVPNAQGPVEPQSIVPLGPAKVRPAHREMVGDVIGTWVIAAL